MSDSATNRRQVRLGIVTPMASEAGTAVQFVQAVLERCEGFQEVQYFVVLDHACRDETRQLLEDFAGEEKRLRVVWAPENRGVVDAYVRGYREALAAGSDWILEIDGGFSHQPEDIPPFFDLMETGDFDCLFGSRFINGGKFSESSLKRWLTSWGGTVLSTLFLGTKMEDMTSGFELFSRETLTNVLERGIQSRGPFFQTEIKFYCRHLRHREIPIHYKAASHQIGSKAMKDAWVNLWRLRREKLISL